MFLSSLTPSPYLALYLTLGSSFGQIRSLICFLHVGNRNHLLLPLLLPLGVHQLSFELREEQRAERQALLASDRQIVSWALGVIYGLQICKLPSCNWAKAKTGTERERESESYQVRETQVGRLMDSDYKQSDSITSTKLNLTTSDESIRLVQFGRTTRVKFARIEQNLGRELAGESKR